jgi:hypothetical protein
MSKRTGNDLVGNCHIGHVCIFKVRVEPQIV